MHCPVCNDRWPDDALRCHCGYDFETRDPSVAILRMKNEARFGNRLWFRGLFLMIALPLAIFLLPPPMHVGVALIQAGLAGMWIIKGLATADRANKRLAAAKQLVQLPAARIVER